MNLGAGSGSQAEQTARIMVEFERDLLSNPTDIVVVVGDVTSTLACTIVAKKLGTRVAHVEGGIRSFDRAMPEEINRLVTDSISDYFFTTSTVANDNLLKEGIRPDQIYFVGNTMIDTLHHHLHQLVRPGFFDHEGLEVGNYFVLTLHRPANVDDAVKCERLLKAISSVAKGKIVFPVHPRTRKTLEQIAGLTGYLITDPMSYLEFIYLIKHAKAVITDSGGVQEESTVLGIPCLTLRPNTERPETVTTGTNELIGDDIEKLGTGIKAVNDRRWKTGSIPERWDGRTSERIVEALLNMP